MFTVLVLVMFGAWHMVLRQILHDHFNTGGPR